MPVLDDHVARPGVGPHDVAQQLARAHTRRDRVVGGHRLQALAHGPGRTVLLRHAADRIDADAAEQLPILHDRVHLVVLRVDVVVEPVGNRDRRRHDHRVAAHELGDGPVLDQLADDDLLVGRRGCTPQERADQEPPHAADQVAGDQREGADDHQAHAERSADLAGDVGRRAQVALALPQRRAQHAPAVERERRREVEDGHREIDQRHRLGNADDGQWPASAARRRLDEPEHVRQQEARDRPGDRHQELGLRTRRFLLHLGDAAEQEQRDAAYLHAVVARDHRVRELVKHDGEEHADGDGDAHPGVGAACEIGVLLREQAGAERPADQQCEHQPADVELHLETEQREQPYPPQPERFLAIRWHDGPSFGEDRCSPA